VSTASTISNYASRSAQVCYLLVLVNDGLRRVIKNRGSFPNDEAALKLIYLAMQHISQCVLLLFILSAVKTRRDNERVMAQL
jgi:transposase-like protein